MSAGWSAPHRAEPRRHHRSGAAKRCPPVRIGRTNFKYMWQPVGGSRVDAGAGADEVPDVVAESDPAVETGKAGLQVAEQRVRGMARDLVELDVQLRELIGHLLRSRVIVL